MLNTKSFLALDFGAGSVKVLEFEQNEAGGLRLKQYGYKALGPEASQEATREAAVLKGLQELLAEKQFTSKKVNVCAPGIHVFSKFGLKLPPADSSKIAQIIQYEAQQNVPFPLDEVVWDYQILGAGPTGELEVLLVAIKSDVVESLFRVSEAAGLQLQLVDISAAALNNAFRYNYGDLEGCTMFLDIGARTSNLLFFEKGKVFARSINVGSNAITQEFANENKMTWADAEAFKTQFGFVALGGAYEEPDDPQQAQISKISRQVMTRLHIQINQTMQVYRGQGGTAPARLFLSGGGSILPYSAQFFAEKLNLPVDYFNPLRNVEFDPSIDLEDLSKIAHSLGETVGLGLRNLANCPIELNLVPKSVLSRQQFNQKKPFFIAAVFSLVLVVFAMGFVYDKMAGRRNDKLQEILAQIEPLEREQQVLGRLESDLKKLTNQLNQITLLAEERFYWGDLLGELRRILIQTEQEVQTASSGKKVGVWIEEFTPLDPADPNFSASGGRAAFVAGGEGREGRSRGAEAKKPRRGKSAEVNEEIDLVKIKCRVIPSELGSTVYDALEKELRKSSFFDPETRISGNFDADPTTDTFSFTAELKLKRKL